jgi:PKD repeat protein
MFACMVISIIVIGILLPTPIIGIIISNASASTTTEEPEEPEPSPAEPPPAEEGQPTTTEEVEQPPPPPLTASMTIDSTNGDTAPATFLFETEPEGGTEPYTFSWDFGDGSPQSNEQNTEHTFVNPGTYVVSLTVTDSAGNFVLEEREVTVRPATTTTPTNVTTPKTNVTTPTPTTNQTETTGPPDVVPGPEEVTTTQLCPPGYATWTHINWKSGGAGGPVGTTDSLTEFSVDGGITWARTPIVSAHPAWDTIPNTGWISSGNLNAETWYRTTFELPPNFVILSLQISFHADDRADVYLNFQPTTAVDPIYLIGTSAAGPAAAYTDPPDVATTTDPALFKPGTNTIYFSVFDTGQIVTGLDYEINLEYCY